MNRSDVTGNLDNRVVTILDEVEAATDLQVQFQTLNESYVVAQYRFDPHSDTATLFLRSDWEDVDVAHELMHMKLELVEDFAVLAWRSKVSRTNAIEAAFGRIKGIYSMARYSSRRSSTIFTPRFRDTCKNFGQDRTMEWPILTALATVSFAEVLSSFRPS